MKTLTNVIFKVSLVAVLFVLCVSASWSSIKLKPEFCEISTFPLKTEEIEEPQTMVLDLNRYVTYLTIEEINEKLEKIKQEKATTVQPKITYTKKVVDTVTENYSDEYFTVDITAYCGCSQCCGIYATSNPNKYGASGDLLYSGYSVASDYFPFGTILHIEGYGNVRVSDRFGSGKGRSRLDLYFDSHYEALNWGRRTYKAKVIN